MTQVQTHYDVTVQYIKYGGSPSILDKNNWYHNCMQTNDF